MIKQGFTIDPHTNFVIEKRGTYDDKRIENMYYKFDGELIPIAYVYPIENEAAVIEALSKLKMAKKIFDDVQAHVFYKILPKLR